MRYNFSIAALVEKYLPTFLRKPRLLAWLRALFTPFVDLQASFAQYRAAARLELEQNGQVVRLRNLLNDRLDPVLRRIRIVDASNKSFVLSEIADTIISESFDTIIFDLSDFDSSVSFLVRLPAEIVGEDFVFVSEIEDFIISESGFVVFSDITGSESSQRLNELIQNYKIAGKTYSIETTI